MKYFKNTELAQIYHVSEKSVRNWIEASLQSKLSLELHQVKNRNYIANTTKNQLAIEQLVLRGQKYKNRRGHKTIAPNDAFYHYYNQTHILDIISHLDIHREVPLQYSYFDGGADYWAQYNKKLLTETTPNMLNSAIELLSLNRNYIDQKIIASAPLVNVIDIGAGEGSPVKEFLGHLHEQQRLNRYIAIDLSKELLAINKRHITTWFEGKIIPEQYVRDINYDRLSDILAEETATAKSQSIVNLFVIFGGTLENLRLPGRALQGISNSMGRNDFLLYTTKLDTEGARRYFDFDPSSHVRTLAPRHKIILDMLNINEEYYDVEQYYDEQARSRFIRIKLNVDLTLRFTAPRLNKQLSFTKGERITIWRGRHQTTVDVVNLFDQNGFDLMQATKTPNQEYILAISKIKTNP